MKRLRKLSVSVLIGLLLGMYMLVPTLRSEEVNPLCASFKEIKKTPLGTYALFTITNTGRNDIDDISMGLWLKDSHGETLSAMGVQDQTPGFVWLKAGQSKLEGVPLDGHYQKAKLLMETNPNEAHLVIEVKSITYMDSGSSRKSVPGS